MSVARTVSALGEPTRFAVVEHLRSGPARAGELAAAVGCSAPALTRHLRALRDAGLVEESGVPEDGRVRVYTLRAEPFGELSGWAGEAARFWADQLGGFAARVERRAVEQAPPEDR